MVCELGVGIGITIAVCKAINEIFENEVAVWHQK